MGLPKGLLFWGCAMSVVGVIIGFFLSLKRCWVLAPGFDGCEFSTAFGFAASASERMERQCFMSFPPQAVAWHEGAWGVVLRVFQQHESSSPWQEKLTSC